MTLNFHVPDYNSVLNEIPNSIMVEDLQEYLDGGRQDVLTNIDIFCDNVRSKLFEKNKFELFFRTTVELADVIVFPVYLELFEFEGKQDSILFAINHWCNKYKDKIVVFFWNHDSDFARYNSYVESNNNAAIINYGYTSECSKRDISIPFWAINTKIYNEPKNKMFSFIGSVNNQLRHRLATSILDYINNTTNDYSFYFSSNIPYEQYLQGCSSSYFSLCPLGGVYGGGFSYRFFEMFLLDTIPVIIVDRLVWPMRDIIDWEKMCVRIPESKCNDLQYIYDTCTSIDYKEMQKNITKNRDKLSLAGVQNYVYEKLQDRIVSFNS